MQQMKKETDTKRLTTNETILSLFWRPFNQYGERAIWSVNIKRIEHTYPDMRKLKQSPNATLFMQYGWSKIIVVMTTVTVPQCHSDTPRCNRSKSNGIPLVNLTLSTTLLFGQQPQRGRWPMLSHTWGIFSSSSFSFFVPHPPQIPISRPKFQSQGQNPSPEAQIPALRPKS